MSHTPGPWETNAIRFVQTARGFKPIAEVYIHNDLGETRANARRIVACVNACEGIPTEALEAGVVNELLRAAKLAMKVFLGGANMGTSMETIETAIAKARGEEG